MNNQNFVIRFNLIDDGESVSIFINDRLFGFVVDEKSVSIMNHYGESIELDFQSDSEAQRAYDFIHECIRNEATVRNGLYHFEESYIEE